MKTIRWLKISFFITGIYCFLCILSAGMIIYGAESRNVTVFHAGNVLIYSWIVNPMGLTASAIGLIYYRIEKREPELCAAIGRKWIRFLIYVVIDVLFWTGTGLLLTIYF